LANRHPFKVSLEMGDEFGDPVRQTISLAEEEGFRDTWLGDHFMPWGHTGKRAGAVWSAMGYCLERTKRMRIGPMVTTPIGGRYHPGVIAQAAATLDAVFPGRVLMAVGAGEAINEYPFMEAWPQWKERMERLLEGVALIRKFWESDSYFDFQGKYFGKKDLFLYTKPRKRIDILISAFGAKSARLSGINGDGLITTSARTPFEVCRDVIFPGFDEGARSSRRDPSGLQKAVLLVYTFDSEREFLRSARESALGRFSRGGLDETDTRRVEMASDGMTERELLSKTAFCSGWSELVELIDKYRKIGATQIILPCGPDRALVRNYAKKVLPHFAS